MTLEDPKVKMEFFYRKFYRDLLEKAKRIVQDESTAKDMVHETFEQSVRYFDRIDTEKTEQAYWYYQAILKSRCGEYFRRTRRILLVEEVFDMPEMIRIISYSQKDTDKDPYEIMEMDERRKETRRVLGELSQREQDVIHLYYTEHQTYRQIAEKYGTSTDMIGVILYRAKRKMESRLRNKTE